MQRYKCLGNINYNKKRACSKKKKIQQKHCRQTATFNLNQFSSFCSSEVYKGSYTMKQDRQTYMLEVRNLARGLKLSVIMTTVCVNSSAYDTYYDIRTTIYVLRYVLLLRVRACIACECWNNVRFVTNDFCLHNTGFKT